MFFLEALSSVVRLSILFLSLFLFSAGPPSGGVSSGYESMQCDGSACTSFERVNQKSPVKTDHSKGERVTYMRHIEEL